MHVHRNILGSFFKNSFDRTRPQIGICVKYTSPEGIAKVLQHNRAFTQGVKLMPPMKEDLASGPVYASLAGTHLNIALRCIKNGVESPVGDLQSLMSQATLCDAVMNGHRWWILPEGLDKEKQTDISLWRNQDQNENQTVHELEVLQTLQHAAETLLSKNKSSVTLADLQQ